MVISYRRISSEQVKHVLIKNGIGGYFLDLDRGRSWADVREFVRAMDKCLAHPIVSTLYREFMTEVRVAVLKVY